jgi:hypothetical protein
MASTIQKTHVDDTIPVMVADQALGALAGQLQLAAVADRNWENDFAQFGETVDVPLRGALTANDKAAGAPVTLQQPSTTKVSIVLNKHKEVALSFEDVAVAFSKTDNEGGYVRDAAIVIAEAIEVAGFVEAYTAFTTNADLGAQGVPVDHALVLGARKTLKDAKVPQGQAVYLFLGTQGMMDLLQLPEYRDADKIGSTEVVDNAPMSWKRYGVNFVESQYVQAVGQLVHNLALCPKEGLALAMRPLKLPSGGVISAVMTSGEAEAGTAGLGLRVIHTYQHADLAELITVDALFGWKVIRGAFGVDVLS